MEYGRKPYIANESYPEMMRRLTDAAVLPNTQEPHSEMKKPYLADSYEEMEYFYSPPGVKPYDPLPYEPFEPEIVNPGDLPYDPYNPWGLQLCLDGSALDVSPGNGSRVQIPLGGSMLFSVSGSVFGGEYVWEEKTPAGSFGGGGGSIVSGNTVTFNSFATPTNLAGYRDHFTVTDGVCVVKVPFEIVDEGVCPVGTVDMTWDSTNSAETITRNGSAIIYVSDGEWPFAYIVSGVGYSLSNGKTAYTTSSRSVELFANGSSCGSAEITVTDACGTVVSGGVRNTDAGKWVLLSDPGDAKAKSIFQDVEPDTTAYPYLYSQIGAYKLIETIRIYCNPTGSAMGDYHKKFWYNADSDYSLLELCPLTDNKKKYGGCVNTPATVSYHMQCIDEYYQWAMGTAPIMLPPLLAENGGTVYHGRRGYRVYPVDANWSRCFIDGSYTSVNGLMYAFCKYYQNGTPKLYKWVC